MNVIDKLQVENSPLGKSVSYEDSYNPELLFAIPRLIQREKIGISSATLPFYGVDIWNAYELSWLNEHGKPMVAVAEFWIPCDSPNIIESKSFKLYLNSFNQTQFSSITAVKKVLAQDLSAKSGTAVKVALFNEQQALKRKALYGQFQGLCLDDLAISCNKYEVSPGYLMTSNEIATESLYSNLLKSNCLVTGQPDFGSLQISYSGKKINHEGLLRYIVSFRKHMEFHEQCVERMFVDIHTYCQPEQLTIAARYTRRGGLDINPYRSTQQSLPVNLRLYRQ